MSPHRLHRILPLLVVLALVSPGRAQQSEEPVLPPGLGDDDAEEEQEQSEKTLADRLPKGLHGFLEARLGPRTGTDPAHRKDFTLAEIRFQASFDRAWKHMSLDTRGDLILDAVTEQAETDLRQFRLTFRPVRPLDLQVGRQIMTWGTGDLLFINDLFPKDWQSFFIGRDEDYLKAPSDALRVGLFAGPLGVDVVYTPEFEPDRFIRGERISFFDSFSGDFVGDATPLSVNLPDDAFDDDEIAARIYGSVGSYEIAGYGYRGFWKSPGGSDPVRMQAIFPALDVWGASVRGPLGPGIGNLELGYYDSRDDADGDDPLVNNGEFRLLAGFELELARELNGGFQYYLEHMLDHARYLESLPGDDPRDETRHVVTVRITKLLRGQTFIPSIFLYYSPSDRDGYLRPRLVWKRSDHQIVEFGANTFFGRHSSTFFGQFENGSNAYASIRFQL